ncbi:hypothetical protein ACSFA7_22600 [Variovorax sp. LT1R20]|uniref:hypothetical protein n=1 Tax=Variovorax sp. LT1R20 TaxID=3443729 RepID=UPI003F478442
MTEHLHPQQPQFNPASTTMTDNISTSAAEPSGHANFTQAEPGTIHSSRYCGNCSHLRSDVDADEHPEGMCGRFGWDLLNEDIARCTGHQTDGEKVINLHRPARAMDAPTEWGTSAAYLDTLAEVLRFKEAGDTKSPDFLNSMCELIESAPQSYFDGLDAMQAGAAAEWRTWAVGHRAWLQGQQDRIDYPDFYQGLKEIGEAIALHGEDAVHGSPEYADLFADLMLCAPPRFKAEADRILGPLIPKATHVNDNGEPVYAVQQIAEKLGVPIERVEADIERFIAPERLHRGPTHPIQ